MSSLRLSLSSFHLQTRCVVYPRAYNRVETAVLRVYIYIYTRALFLGFITIPPVPLPSRPLFPWNLPRFQRSRLSREKREYYEIASRASLARHAPPLFFSTRNNKPANHPWCILRRMKSFGIAESAALIEIPREEFFFFRSSSYFFRWIEGSFAQSALSLSLSFLPLYRQGSFFFVIGDATPSCTRFDLDQCYCPFRSGRNNGEGREGLLLVF